MRERAEAIVTRRSSNISFIWLIPLVTALVGLLVFIDYQWSKGPTITLVFDQAENISPNKTELKAMNVKVGIIKTIKLSEDSKRIIATAQLDKIAAQMLREDTQFWIVKPRITKDGITGLSTLLSGPYINVHPGVKSHDTRKKTYNVLKSPPVAGPDVEGLRIQLVHNHMGKLDVGDPVYFKGYLVGRVESMRLDVLNQQVIYQLFVYAPYNSLIHENTHFWLTKPFDLSLTEKGIHLQLGSLENLLLGGVTFDVIDQLPPGKKITENNRQFELYSSAKQVQSRYFSQFTHFVMFFNESIRGLHAMAAIEYKGIRVGSAVKVPFNFHDPLTYPEKQIPVLVSIDIGKLQEDKPSHGQRKSMKSLANLCRDGLVASLHPSNLITGQLVVDLTFEDAKPDFQIDRYQGYLVFPTRPSSFTQLQKEISTFIGSLKKISMDGSLKKKDKTLVGFNRFVTAATRVMTDLDGILRTQEAKALPESLNTSLRSLQETLQSFSSNSRDFHNVQQGLIHLDDVLIQLAPLLEQLNQKSNALIFSGSKHNDPVPRSRAP